MIKRSFFGLTQPRFHYEAVRDVPRSPDQMPVPGQVRLFVREAFDGKFPLVLQKGDRVRTGQKLVPFDGSDAYVISSVTGTVSGISPYTGDFGQTYTDITIDAEPEDEFDEAFKAAVDEQGIEAGRDFLATVPGGLPLAEMLDSGHHVDTLIVCGIERDLLTVTHQAVMSSQTEAMNLGVSILKRLLGVHKVVLAMPQNIIREAGTIGGASGVEIRPIDTTYPAAKPKLIMRDVMGQEIPADKRCEDYGIFFVSAEAVASVGKAFDKGRIPVTKTVTVIRKDLSKVVMEVRMGTAVGDIFNELGISVRDRDRIVIGGPMTGSAIYALEHPVLQDTDTIMVQDSSDIPDVMNNPCINCGECVRICPADIPVNMLVRLLEARQYEIAADDYDLHSCVECGLCSFVCPSKIPIFQYIQLGKYELARIRKEEEEATDV